MVRSCSPPAGWWATRRAATGCCANGEVVFERDRIVFVGFDYPGEVARRIDYGHALIGPGFIDLDALSDLDTTILGFDNQPAWRKGRVWPRGLSATPGRSRCTRARSSRSRSATPSRR